MKACSWTASEAARIRKKDWFMSMESTDGSLCDLSFDKEGTGSGGGTSGTVDMITPQEKLCHFESRAQSHADAQEYDACIQDLVRCVALTRLVHGDGHLELAQAHAKLAKAYLQFKGWGTQAQEHAVRARDILPLSSLSSTSPEERLQMHACLLSIHQTQGGAALLLDSLKEAESSFEKAKLIVEELSQSGGLSKEERLEADLKISTSLFRVFQRQGRSDQALRQCEASLELLEGCDRPGQVCPIYQDMAAIEQARGHLDRAIEHLSTAHAIAVSQCPGDLEGARVAHSLALALSTAAQPLHNDSATKYFLESLTAYRSLLGSHDAATLSVQDDYCRLLLLTGQQQSCLELQRASLPLKKAAFGDLSPEVAGTLQLIGGVEMAQGQVRQAHRSMRKCLEIQNVLFGSHHKTTRATQKTVDMLAQAPEVAGRQRAAGKGKTRPPFCAVLPSSS